MKIDVGVLTPLERRLIQVAADGAETTSAAAIQGAVAELLAALRAYAQVCSDLQQDAAYREWRRLRQELPGSESGTAVPPAWQVRAAAQEAPLQAAEAALDRALAVCVAVIHRERQTALAAALLLGEEAGMRAGLVCAAGQAPAKGGVGLHLWADLAEGAMDGLIGRHLLVSHATLNSLLPRER